MKKEKTYTCAPLPFMGQKRRFLKQFKNCLNDNFKENNIFVDLFGGSGLLSHTTKRLWPSSRVIYNDFDNYSTRIENIPTTNKIIAELRELLQGYTREKTLTTELKKQVLQIIKKYDEKGYVDYISLSSSLLFSMKYALDFESLSKESFYNSIRKSDFDATGYLDGLEIVHKDYRDLFEEFRSIPRVVFFVDPPYLSTECSVYDNYWKLSDYLDVLKVLRSTSYCYFTSNKSSIVELCEWIEKNKEFGNPFREARKEEMINRVAINTVYTDIMLTKKAA